MSRKHVVKYIALDAVLASDPQLTLATNVENTDGVSYHVKFDAPATGTFVVEARNADVKATDTGAWYPVSFGTPLAIIAELDVQILLNLTPFKEMRLVWTPTTASGNMSAYLIMKTVGA